MPPAKVTMNAQLHELFEQAQAARTRSRLLAGQLHATQRKSQENWQLIQASWHQTELIQTQRLAARTKPDRLRRSAYARLQAQLATLPVIEQAKGIIMAKYGWPADLAFDALRRASQRENIKVRDLATRIVERTASSAQRQPGPAPTAAGSGSESMRRAGSGRSRDRARLPA